MRFRALGKGAAEKLLAALRNPLAIRRRSSGHERLETLRHLREVGGRDRLLLVRLDRALVRGAVDRADLESARAELDLENEKLGIGRGRRRVLEADLGLHHR